MFGSQSIGSTHILVPDSIGSAQCLVLSLLEALVYWFQILLAVLNVWFSVYWKHSYIGSRFYWQCSMFGSQSIGSTRILVPDSICRAQCLVLSLLEALVYWFQIILVELNVWFSVYWKQILLVEVNFCYTILLAVFNFFHSLIFTYRIQLIEYCESVYNKIF